MIHAKEATDSLRAIITVLRGKPAHKDREPICPKEIPSVWLTDCQSLHDYLVNPVAQGREDKRLDIDLESLRECLWEYADGRLKDEITEAQSEKPRWIDTSTMLCDPLTKAGSRNVSARLQEAMSTGIMSLEATAASQLKKMQQQKARMNNIPEVKPATAEDNWSEDP